MLSNTIKAQVYKFGKVSKEELEEKFYPLDSSANAVILYKKRSSFYDYSEQLGVRLISDYNFRIKIYNEKGYNWATKQIQVLKNDEISSLKAATYNLEDGKIVISKLGRKSVFREETSKFRKVEKFTLPNIKDGCVIEMKYRIASPNYSSVNDMVLQYSVPVKKYEGSVSLLGYFNFNKRTKGYLDVFVNETTRRNPKLDVMDKRISISKDNIPALIEESYVNNINNYRTGMVFEVASVNIPGQVYKQFSTTWSDVAKRIYESQSFGGELKKKSILKDEKIEELKLAELSDNEKIVAALEYVKSKIK